MAAFEPCTEMIKGTFDVRRFHAHRGRVLPWSAYDGQFIRSRQRKGKKGKGRRVKIAVGPALKAMLDRIKRAVTVVFTTSNNTDGFRAELRQGMPEGGHTGRPYVPRYTRLDRDAASGG
jgi:hypothetical protein